MKRLFAILVAVAVAMCSCSKIFDTSVLERNIVELKDRVTALEEQCKQMNTNISSLQAIVTALQDNDYVTGVAPITQNGVEIGYTISFSKSGSITIYHGKDGSNGLDGSDGSDGSDGASGSTPVVGVKQDTDGVYYWTLNGEWLLNDSGEKVKAISTDGKDGEDGQDGTNGKDGKDGITPQLKIENGYWYVSYNNGESWESLGKATGDNGQDGANGADGAAGSDGDSFFQSVTQDENNVIFTLADGTVITVPKSSSYLFNKLQSVSYVPKFNDGKATVYYSAANNSQVEMDFEVSPKDAVEDIVAQWETILSLKAVNTQTRAVTYIDMPILGCTADAQHGVITVTASGKNLAENFFAGEQTVSVRLGISDGNTNITSEFIPLVAAKQPNNEIWYTSTDGNIVEPYDKTVFGANIISNTYKNGKGIITFDGEVTEIGNYAFSNCSGLTSVTIPNSVTVIGDNAFAGCSDLTSVTIPNSVTEIGIWAFSVCVSLTSVTIPDSVTKIGNYAFSNCSGLTNVTIPDSVTSIGRNPFEDCKNLAEFNGKFAAEDGRCLIVDGVLKSFAPAGITTYNIPDSVTEIGENAFCHCESLTSVTIPDSVTKIGEYAFLGCDGLTSVTIPDSVTKIGGYAFWGCSGLTSITIPDSVTEIGNYAFEYCSSLTSVTIPDSVIEIGNNPFYDCKNLAEFKGKFAADNGRCLIIDGILNSFAQADLSSYTIPDNVTKIGDYAFGICDGLTSITIPDSVTEIGERAFYSCDGLTSIAIPDSVTVIGENAFYSCRTLSSITIPNSVTRIEDAAFGYCSGLTSITIPDSVTEIGWYAFGFCSGLTSVFCERTTPPTAYFNNDSWIAFDDNATDRKIYVPTESVDAYKAANGWSDYADAIEPYDFSAVSE